MIEPVERHMQANGLRHRLLTWNDEGSPTVVLCHGFLDHAWSFHRLAQPLAEAGLRVVGFDWRGHGGTDHVGAGGYYHFLDYVLDLHELMPLLASGEVHLAGHSMGGTAAALYAGTHPKVPRTLTLVEGIGPPSFAGDPADKVTAWLDSMDRFRRTERRPIRDLAEAVMRLRAMTPELPVELAYFLADKATVRAPDGGPGLALRPAAPHHVAVRVRRGRVPRLPVPDRGADAGRERRPGLPHRGPRRARGRAPGRAGARARRRGSHGPLAAPGRPGGRDPRARPARVRGRRRLFGRREGRG